MPVGITIKTNVSPLTKLTNEVKAARKEVREAQKEVDKLKKEGKQVTDDVVKRLKDAESRKFSLEKKLKEDGLRMRAEERFGKQAADHIDALARDPYSVSSYMSVINDRIEGSLNKVAQSKAVQTFLTNNSVVQLVGGKAMASAAQKYGWRAMGEAAMASPAGAVAGGIAITGGLPFALSKIDSALGGPKYSDALREMRLEQSVNERTSGNLEQKEIDREKLGLAEYNAKGTLAKSWFGRTDREANIAWLETKQSARAAGMSEADVSSNSKFTESVLNRFYLDKYGSMGPIIRRNLVSQGMIALSGGDQKEVEEMKKKAIEAAVKFRDKGDALVLADDGLSNIGAANAAYAAAGQSISRPSNWRDAMEVWRENQDALKGAANWSIQQCQLPALREWE
ncbi:MAG TPA: hypothetical protein VGP72_16510 [Planctomycetota bacterium]